MKINYVLCDPDFFSNGFTGSVRHAQGIVNGLLENAITVTTFCHENGNSFFRSAKVPVLPVLNKSNFVAKILFTLKVMVLSSNKEADFVLIRKNIFVLLVDFFTFRYFSNKSTVWEVNGVSGADKKNSLYSFIVRFLHFVVFYNRTVYIVNSNIKEELLDSHFLRFKKTRFVLIPNGSPSVVSINRRFDDDAMHLFYFGNFQLYNDFYSLVDYACNCFEDNFNIYLHFVGFGAQEDFVRSSASRFSFIEYHGKKTPEEVISLDFISGKCVGVVPLSKDCRTKILSPIKLYEYASLGLPILIGNSSPYENKGIFSYNDLDSFKAALTQLVQPDFYNACSKQTTIFASDNSWVERMRLFLTNLEV